MIRQNVLGNEAERSSIMTSKKYKELSVTEFTKAAEIYESDNAGVPGCTWSYLKKEAFADCIVL